MVKRILIVLLWARCLEVCSIILSSFTVIFLRLDRLWMKYNSQILACKEKQRCGWLGPWNQLSIIVICTNTTTIFGMCLVFLTGKTQAIMFMTLPKVYSQHEKLSKESEKISIKVKFSYCLCLCDWSPRQQLQCAGVADYHSLSLRLGIVHVPWIVVSMLALRSELDAG